MDIFTSFGAEINNIPVHRDVRQQIVTFLQDQLSVALAIYNTNAIVQIQETVKLIENITPRQCLKVVKSLWDDQIKFGKTYSDYLVKTRQNLLEVLCYFDNVLKYTARDKHLTDLGLTRLCTQNFYQANSKALQVTADKFRKFEYSQQDERVEEINKVFKFLVSKLSRQNLFRTQKSFNLAMDLIEKQIYSSIYKNALQPRGEVDNDRDELFNQLVDDLSASIAVSGISSSQLEIKHRYMSGAPWRPAVLELKMLNCFCSPKSKVECIGRTLQKIVHLLRLSSPEVIPGADDILPVLIYVVIQAKPAHLITSLQFIELYYPEVKSGQGESSYNFALFQSAVNFISTMKVLKSSDETDETERNITVESAQ